MQNPPPPPPPPPSGGYQPPLPPSGAPGAIEAAGAAGNLASPGMRIVGGLIDVVILLVVNAIVGLILQKAQGVAGIINLAIDIAYFAYFWSSRGASIGMMPFGFKVRDIATGQYPTMGKAAIRGLVWCLEVGFTVCIVGAIGWLWPLWDPQKQAWHDKAAGTIVTVT
jgi:uncharacterized RDD family membrane protein YckC